MSPLPRDVVIFGSGGLGREVLWTLQHADAHITDVEGTNWSPRLLGFVDDNAASHGSVVNGTDVLGGSDWLLRHPETLVLMAVGIPTIRRKVVEKLSAQQVRFATLISPHSIVGDSSIVGEGSIVLPGAVVTVNARLGRFVLLNPTTSVSHDAQIGDFTSLGPGVSLAGNVTIGRQCDIGTNASVIPGIQIGNSTIVGAGACVTGNLPDNVTAVGVPARVVKARTSETTEL